MASTAPVGETFEVIVGDSLGNVETFSLLRTEGDPKQQRSQSGKQEVAES